MLFRSAVLPQARLRGSSGIAGAARPNLLSSNRSVDCPEAGHDRRAAGEWCEWNGVKAWILPDSAGIAVCTNGTGPEARRSARAAERRPEFGHFGRSGLALCSLFIVHLPTSPGLFNQGCSCWLRFAPQQYTHYCWPSWAPQPVRQNIGQGIDMHSQKYIKKI